MNIVLVNRYYPPHGGYGGIAVHNRYLSQALVKLGCRVSIITSRRSKNIPEFEEKAGIQIHRLLVRDLPRIHRLPCIGRYMRPLNQWGYSFRVAQKILFLEKNDKPNLIEFADIEAEGYVYLLNKKRTCPVIVRCHTPIFILRKYRAKKEMPYSTRLTGLMEKYAIRHADILTAPSKNMAAMISKECGLPIGEIQVIPNALDTASYDFETAKSFHAPNEILVLHVGRFDRAKGVEVLAQAIPEMVKKNANLKFVFIGYDNINKNESSWKASLEDYFDEKNVKTKVALLRQVDQDALLSWYQKADIAVVPSLIYESFSYTCAQAMAAGIPVVASRIGGIPETVDDGISGILTEPGNVHELSAAILRLAQDTDLRKMMGQAGRTKAQQVFDADQTAKQFLKLVSSIG